MGQTKVKTKNIDELIVQIKRGEAIQETKASKKNSGDIRHDGPAKHSYPRKKEMEKLIDYNNLAYPMKRPNKVKLSISDGESRFPAEAKVPNYKKYDENGNYIKHKVPNKPKNPEASGVSALSIMRNMSLSNPAKGRKKTVT